MKTKRKPKPSDILGLAFFRGFYTRSPYTPHGKRRTGEERKRFFAEKVVFHAFDREWRRCTDQRIFPRLWPGENYVERLKRTLGEVFEKNPWRFGYDDGCKDTKEVFKSLIQRGVILVNEKAIGREIDAAARIKAHDLPRPSKEQHDLYRKTVENEPLAKRRAFFDFMGVSKQGRETTAAAIRWDAEEWADIFPNKRKLKNTRHRALQEYVFEMMKTKETKVADGAFKWQSWKAWATEIGCLEWEVKDAMESLRAAGKIKRLREVEGVDPNDKPSDEFARTKAKKVVQYDLA